MGTRSVTYIHNGNRDDAVLCAIYRQMDGYPTGMGKDLKDALDGKTLVNGISGDRGTIMNGMGCAAAQIVAGLKREAGGIYINLPDCVGEEYDYHIYFDGDKFNPPDGATLSLEVIGYGKSIYNGPFSEFDPVSVEESEHT